MEPPETITVQSSSVGCDGGGALGHPLVYLTLDASGRIDCPYCGQRYVLAESARTESGGH